MKLIDFFRNLWGNENETPQPESSTPKVKRVRRTSSKVTKQQQVKSHLIQNGTITSWEAIQLYGATRLSGIIYRFRNEGMDIQSVKESSIDRNGNVCNFVTYHYHNGIN